MSNAPHRARGFAVIALTLAWLLPVCAARGQAEVPEQLRADVAALTEHPHRLSGSEHGHAAATYLTRRLGSILGPSQVTVLEMPVMQTHVARCELEIDGRVVSLTPMRPNVLMPPVTPPGGLTGPLLYVGSGGLGAYDDRAVDRAIVVMRYARADRVEQAFALGAQAVIVLDEEGATPRFTPTSLPIQQPRYYVSREQLGDVDLTRDRESVTLHSRVVWQRTLGRNIIGVLPAAEPTFTFSDGDGRGKQEAIVLAAAYDSFGHVPHRSPAARRAANVAAVLQAAERFAATPPRRPVIFMLLDNRARSHQGARYVYDSWMMDPAQRQDQAQQHQTQLERTEAMAALLESKGLTEATAASEGRTGYLLREALSRDAEILRAEIFVQIRTMRLTAVDANDPKLGERIDQLTETSIRWDQIRRALHNETLGAFVAEHADEPVFRRQFEQLTSATSARLADEIGQLRAMREFDEQAEQLAELTGRMYPLVHVTLDLGDAGAHWSLVAGHWLSQAPPYDQTPAGSDAPGHYTRLLDAMREAVDGLSRVDIEPMRTPSLGVGYAGGPFAHGGYVAGLYGVFNLAAMTGGDARPRDGHPSDTLDQLDLAPFHAQADQVITALNRAADMEAMSIRTVLRSHAESRYLKWSGFTPTGDAALLSVTGTLTEDRPASGALVASWPARNADTVWGMLADANIVADFQPVRIEQVNEQGRFRTIGTSTWVDGQQALLGMLFDSDGRATAMTNYDTLLQKRTATFGVHLLRGEAYGLSHLETTTLNPANFLVLQGRSNTRLRENRAAWGQRAGQSFWFISDSSSIDRVKVFQRLGPVVLGKLTEEDPVGAGVPLGRFDRPRNTTVLGATDLWTLNELRLDRLRRRGVTRADLERLHGRARRLLPDVDSQASSGETHAAAKRSLAMSHRVYGPLRGAMDDLVRAVVVVLILTIPFAFAMERLAIGATTVYGRIGGFIVFFLITFGLLYFTHPGFAIASTPMIIFLAFAIILLSSMVIWIVVRKFDTELRSLQGQSTAVHQANVSQTTAMLAAIAMGISTMRRRPTRTILTAVTVVVLTFTILSFASLSTEVGVSQTYLGPAADSSPGAILVRKVDNGALEAGVPDLLHGMAGADALLAQQWWLVRQSETEPAYTVSRVDDGRSMTISAVMGVSQAERDRWPAFAEALGESDAGPDLPAGIADVPADQHAYLPPVLVQLLDLELGDRLLVAGHPAVYAGPTDPGTLQRMRDVDGEAVLPVNFMDPTALMVQDGGQQEEDGDALVDDVQRSFVYLSADEVVVMTDDAVRQRGGELHRLHLYPEAGLDGEALGEQVARMVSAPVWVAGEQGVSRMLLTYLTSVSGAWAVAIPLLLGGLIIFGTLLGSISDREKEIYTFSALGLSPGHVGMLFFAEAAVYAIVGGVAGQLLAQLVGLLASYLAREGIIPAVSLNYSSTNAMFAIAVVMAIVLISAIYPAMQASRSANPGLARAWRLPRPEGDQLALTFPFTVSAYDITGVVSYLAEHFRQHDDAGLGSFAATDVAIERNEQGQLRLTADLALAPFDLGVTQRLSLTAVPSEIEGIDEVAVEADRESGAHGDWIRLNRTFMKELRKQFLLWRTLSSEAIEHYRMETLQTVGPAPDSDSDSISTEGVHG